jgi:hypothetical protein
MAMGPCSSHAPSLLYFGDIFTIVLNSLHSVYTEDMLNLSKSMLSEMMWMVGKDIFPDVQLFAVIDKAQMAAQYMMESFCSTTTGLDKHPVLHVFHRFH